MRERRKAHRQRSYLGGRIAGDASVVATDCLVRNITKAGAKLVLPASMPLAERFDLTIACQDFSAPARMVWRRDDEVGVVFSARPAAEVFSLDQARRLRDCERERDALKARLAELKRHD